MVEKLKSYQNVEIILLKEIKPSRKRFRLPILIKTIKQLHPDALIVHFCAYSSFHAAIYSGIKPTIGILMGSDINVQGTTIPLYVRLELLFTRLLLPYVEFIACKTNQIKDKVINLRIKGKIMTIPWGVKIVDDFNRNFTDVAKIRISLGLPENAWIVLSPRAMSEKERILEIIEGFAKLKQKKVNAVLIIIKFRFSKNYYHKLLKCIKRLSISDSVFLIPTLARDKLNLYYKTCDVLISNLIHDGMPQTIFEAALRGTTLLLSDLPQYREYFEDGKSAFYCDGSAEDISKKLLQLYENNILAQKLGKNAKSSVIEKANFDKWADTFINELNTTLSEEERIIIPSYKLILSKIILFLIIVFRKIPLNKICHCCPK